MTTVNTFFMRPWKSFLLCFFILCNTSYFSSARNYENIDVVQIREDLGLVWPLVTTVCVEYELAMAQLEFCNSRMEREQFMSEYEGYVKDTYFKKILELDIQQGKLLLLLIDRELGETPYELLRKNLSLKKANFWNRFARFVGADLKGEYSALNYPLIEREILQFETSK